MKKLITIAVTVVAEDTVGAEEIAGVVHTGAHNNVESHAAAFDLEVSVLEAEVVSETPVDLGE